MKNILFGKYGKCVELVSGNFKIYISLDFGPRIIAGFIDDDINIFANLPVEPLDGIDTNFILYGGHRLWISPEVNPRTYAKDNSPVKVIELENATEFLSPVEVESGLQKSITIKPLENNLFEIKHKITNKNNWEIECAPWALSVMAPGGKAIIPQVRNKENSNFIPDHFLILWSYSSLNDSRLNIGDKYIILNQDSSINTPCKVGVNAEDGWVAYLNNDKAFVKYFHHFIDAQYPDNGCSVESYSCDKFCEIETLAPLYTLGINDSVEHIEVWHGISDIIDSNDDSSINKNLIPYIKNKL